MKANAKPVFTKAWWQANRARACKGSGVGKALVKWEKHCTVAGGKVQTRDQFQNIFSTCSELQTALKVAKSKCGKFQKESASCIDKYEVERKKYEESVRKAYEVKLEKYKKDREDLLQLTVDAVKVMEGFATEMQKLEKYMDGLEDEALDDLRNNAGAMLKHYYDQSKPVHSNASSLLEKAKKQYEKDGKTIKERRGPTYDAKSYGLLEADGAKLSHIFEKATENTNVASGFYRDIKNSFANLESELKSLTDCYFQGQKSSAQLEKDAEALVKTAKKFVENIQLEIQKMSSSFGTLESYTKLLKDGKFTDKEKVAVPAHFNKLQTNEAKTNQLMQQFQVVVAKGVKRLPPGRTYKSYTDAARMSVMTGLKAIKEMNAKMTTARQQIKNLLKG